MRTVHVLAIVLFLAPVAPASADLVLTAESRDLSAQPPEVETLRICLAPDRLAVDSERVEGGRSTTLFDAGRKVVWQVEHDAKSYVEVNEQAVRDLGASVDAAMQEMRKRLATLPEEQRRQAEQMLQSTQGAGPERVAWTVREAEQKETILGHPCRRYDLLANGQKRSEIWAASWADAGVTRESFEVLRGFAAFFSTIAASSPMLADALSQQGGILKGLDKVDGFPARIVDFENGKPVHESLFRSVEQKRVDAATYRVPPGYSQRQLLQ